MLTYRIPYIFLIVICILLSVTFCDSKDKEGEDEGTTTTPRTTSTQITPNNTDSNVNGTKHDSDEGGIWHRLKDDGVWLRTFYVLMGVTAIVVVYFGVRAWRARRGKSKSRKYGLITSSGNDLEMEPLDQDDDDEDMTVFEVNNRARRGNPG